jgi:hypothetical protein
MLSVMPILYTRVRIPAREVSEVTGFPEMLGGPRVLAHKR